MENSDAQYYTSILDPFNNVSPTGQTRTRMEDFLKLQSDEIFDNLQIIRTRFSNPITHPSLTKFVSRLTQLLFSDAEIMLPLKNVNTQKIVWIYDETFQIFGGCTYSTIKNAVGQ